MYSNARINLFSSLESAAIDDCLCFRHSRFPSRQSGQELTSESTRVMQYLQESFSYHPSLRRLSDHCFLQRLRAELPAVFLTPPIANSLSGLLAADIEPD